MASKQKKLEATIGGRRLTLTNQDKALWPDDGLTKRDLVQYYRAVAPAILPHLHDRPLTLKLYPDGIDRQPIFLQAAPRGAPTWFKRWPHQLVSRGDEQRVNWRLIATEEAALVWLANRAAIELHTWLSRISAPGEPDVLLFDLDPGPEVPFDAVCRAALDLRAALEVAGLRIWPKTSGGKGMHLAVPLAPGYDFEGVRGWAERLAQVFQERWPDRFTHLAAKEERAGRIMIDYAQNSLGRTTAAVYSARARPGGTVSAPLTWDEVAAGSRSELLPAAFTLKTMPPRIEALGDLFAPVLATPQRLPEDFDPEPIVAKL
jgi:bifunctional non-homologous end joining protein LigD